jgi:hypothetical protein
VKIYNNIFYRNPKFSCREVLPLLLAASSKTRLHTRTNFSLIWPEMECAGESGTQGQRESSSPMIAHLFTASRLNVTAVLSAQLSQLSFCPHSLLLSSEPFYSAHRMAAPVPAVAAAAAAAAATGGMRQSMHRMRFGSTRGQHSLLRLLCAPMFLCCRMCVRDSVLLAF